MSLCNLKKSFSFFILLTLLGAIVYGNTLHVPFLFDDARNIMHPELRLDELTAGAVAGALFGGVLQERPVANLSFALNYFVSGFDLPGYHVVNILLHILTAFFLYLFFQKTLALPVNNSGYGQKKWVAELTAILWLVHPLATQSVTYIVQRMNVLATLFFIVSLYCYVQGRTRQQFQSLNKEGGQQHPWLFFVCCGVAGVLAIGSKEIAATLPFFLFLYEWFFFQDLSRRWLKTKIPWILGVVLVVGVLAFVYLNGHPINYILHGCDWRDFTLQERLLTQPRVIWHYISLIFFPHPDRLVFDYNFPVSTSFLQPFTTILGMAGLLLLFLAAFCSAKKERLFAFAVFFFLGNLVIESSFICLEMIFEHRTYLPSTFLTLFSVLLFFRIIQNRVIVTSLLLLLVCIFSLWTYKRNVIWQDPVIFWQDSVDKYPGKTRSHYNLGRSLYMRGELEQAEESLSYALQLDPNHPLAQNNYGLVLYKTGRVQAAEDHFVKAIYLLPGYVDARNNLAVLLEEEDRPLEALEQYREALKVAPNYAMINKNMGRLLLRMNRVAEALPLLMKAQKENPEQVELLLDVGESLMRLGQVEEAASVYLDVLEYDDAQVSAHFNLALIKSNSGQLDQALEHYERTLQLEPDYVPALYNVGNLLFRLDRFSEAAGKYREVIRLAPQHAGAYNNLGSVLVYLGDMQGAATAFAEAVRINPKDIRAKKNLEQVLQEIGRAGQPTSKGKAD